MENRIAQLRKERRMSQAELAEAVEVTRQTIISLESGRYNASLHTAGVLLLCLGGLAQNMSEVQGGLLPWVHLLCGFGTGLSFVGLLYGSPRFRPLFDRCRTHKLRRLGR